MRFFVAPPIQVDVAGPIKPRQKKRKAETLLECVAISNYHLPTNSTKSAPGINHVGDAFSPLAREHQLAKIVRQDVAGASHDGKVARSYKRPAKHGNKEASPSHIPSEAPSSLKPSDRVDCDEATMWDRLGYVPQLTEDQLSHLKRRVVALCGVEWRSKLPAPLPISLSRTHLQVLKDGNYYVAEKSDGLRAMLFVCTGGDGAPEGVYWIDRKFVFGRMFPHHEATFLATYGDGDTLVDGELVHAMTPCEHSMPTLAATAPFLNYLVYDALSVQGKR
jgi:hypothetical protein